MAAVFLSEFQLYLNTTYFPFAHLAKPIQNSRNVQECGFPWGT